jgi:hypothetical protein
MASSAAAGRLPAIAINLEGGTMEDARTTLWDRVGITAVGRS